MRFMPVRFALALALASVTSGTQAAAPEAPDTGTGPAFTAIGPMAFAPDGTLFAGDTQAGAIFALDLGAAASSGKAGAPAIQAIDEKIGGLLGTSAREVAITDLAVHPKTQNVYISAMRGQGADAKPVLLRIDGAARIDVVDLTTVKFSRVMLPNAPAANATARRNPRTDSITDMAFSDGRLFVAGLSNEEFASKLRTINYPFSAVDSGASVEIYHGAHGQFETRSPVYTFVPYKVNNQTNLIAGYLCTPLVKFPVDSLKPGAKVMGTTIAELGNGNRPIDMILYKKDGKEFLLMSNTSRGVMKIPTDRFATEPGITTRISGKAGIEYETVATLKGVEQLDLLNATHTVMLARTDAGVLNLDVVPLP